MACPDIQFQFLNRVDTFSETFRKELKKIQDIKTKLPEDAKVLQGFANYLQKCVEVFERLETQMQQLRQDLTKARQQKSNITQNNPLYDQVMTALSNLKLGLEEITEEKGVKIDPLVVPSPNTVNKAIIVPSPNMVNKAIAPSTNNKAALERAKKMNQMNREKRREHTNNAEDALYRGGQSDAFLNVITILHQFQRVPALAQISEELSVILTHIFLIVNAEIVTIKNLIWCIKKQTEITSDVALQLKRALDGINDVKRSESSILPLLAFYTP